MARNENYTGWAELKRVAPLIAVSAALGVALPAEAQAAVRVTPSIPAGVTLLPSEAGASAVIVPGSTTVSAVVVPQGCTSDACTISVVADAAPPTSVAALQPPSITPLGGAKIASVIEAPASLEVASAPAAPLIYKYDLYDQLCARYDVCNTWKMRMRTVAYFDGTYAWGSRSRYGMAGLVDCSSNGMLGYSVNDTACEFEGDPSRTDLYSNQSTKVSVGIKGSPVSWNHYMHRHFKGTGETWLVTD